MARKTDRMSAQDKVLTRFRTTINQSGSLGSPKMETLAQQIKSANAYVKTFGSKDQIAEQEDAVMFKRLNSKAALEMRGH